MAAPSIYSLEEIERVVTSDEFQKALIEGIKSGFVALENGLFFAAPIQTLGLPPFPFADVNDYAAQTCIKTGYFKGQEHFVVKVASGGYPLENSGLMEIFSQKTGRLEALLMDNGVLTELRTAAVGAVAAKLLGPKKIETIGILGTGVQARYQLEMLSAVTDCKSVLVWGRTPSKVSALLNEMNWKGWHINSVESPDNLLAECDLIVTTTCSREAILGKTTLDTRKGLLITCIGADAPGKYELNPALVAKADMLVADTTSQSLERGEFQKAVADNFVKSETIISLGKLIKEEHLHRQHGDDRFIIFDSSGVALQDCVISSLVVQQLRRPAED
mmetsp:Transcript_11006/g.20358  ORF Transcript_11006/g.20358 Transcript_11006/m.20358 type:complete len:332 (+) Transcript_11006:110-1105(+)